MFTLKDFKVELKNPEEVKEFVKRHGEFAAVCYNTPKEKATGKYPSAIGILLFIPFIISFIFHHHEYHIINKSKIDVLL